MRTIFFRNNRALTSQFSNCNHKNADFQDPTRTKNATYSWPYGIPSFHRKHSCAWISFYNFRYDALLLSFKAVQGVTGHRKKPLGKNQPLKAQIQALTNTEEEDKRNIFAL